MNEIDCICHAMKWIHKKPVTKMLWIEWYYSVRPDGRLTELLYLPSAIYNYEYQVSTITVAASGISVPQPGLDVLRYDQWDWPYVINIDHFTIVECLPLHQQYFEVLKVTGFKDSMNFISELNRHVFFIKEPSNQYHRMSDFPVHILAAGKRV